MSKWNELVKQITKQNPGKPLTQILPLASVQYQKMKKSLSKSLPISKKVKGGKSRKRKGTRSTRRRH